MYEDLKAADTEIIGVSPDSDASHLQFAKRQRITFHLVSDPRKVLAGTYGATGGVFGILGLLKRVTYVIDTRGKIASVLQNAMSADAHLDAVREALAEIRGVNALST
jgi:peroxiredoxin Q/BCP